MTVWRDYRQSVAFSETEAKCQWQTKREETSKTNHLTWCLNALILLAHAQISPPGAKILQTVLQHANGFFWCCFSFWKTHGLTFFSHTKILYRCLIKSSTFDEPHTNHCASSSLATLAVNGNDIFLIGVHPLFGNPRKSLHVPAVQHKKFNCPRKYNTTRCVQVFDRKFFMLEKHISQLPQSWNIVVIDSEALNLVVEQRFIVHSFTWRNIGEQVNKGTFRF